VAHHQKASSEEQEDSAEYHTPPEELPEPYKRAFEQEYEDYVEPANLQQVFHGEAQQEPHEGF